MALMLDNDIKQVAKPICDTCILIHINQGSLGAFYGNYVNSDNTMTTCVTLMTSNISDMGVLFNRYLSTF